MELSSGHIWFYAMDSALHAVQRDRIRYRVYAYRSPWGGWAYAVEPVGATVVRDRRGTR
jgi:hypothetical protein